MDRGLVAARYAKALFQTCEGDVRVCARLARELGQLEEQMDKGFRELLLSPLFMEQERARVLGLFMEEREFLPTTRNFLNLLRTRGRMSLFSEIATLFRQKMDAMIERVIVTVISSEPLPTKIAMEYGKQIQLVVGHSALLRQVVDPETVGGAKVIINNLMIDGTLLGQYERFKEHMGIPRGK